MVASTTPAGPTRLPAAQRRRQLLDVATPAFASKGFHATSMEEIAESAGVTKPVLYRHFASKRQLYLELLDDVGNRLLEVITTATADAGQPRRQVEAGFTAYFRFMADHEGAFRLLFGSGARRDEEFGDAVRRIEAGLADALAALIEADIDAGHRRVLAHAIIGLAEGVCRLSVGEERELDPERLARQVADFCYAGLRGIHRV